MKHSTQLGERLRKKHHDRVQDGPVVKYPPKTANAAEFWIHTGVCPKCSARAISCGECKQCGWTHG